MGLLGPTGLPPWHLGDQLAITPLALALGLVAIGTIPRRWVSVLVIAAIALVLFVASEATSAGVQGNPTYPIVLGSLAAGLPRYWEGTIQDSARLAFSATFLGALLGGDLGPIAVEWGDPEVVYTIGGAGFMDLLFVGPVMASIVASTWWIIVEARGSGDLGEPWLLGHRDRMDMLALLAAFLFWVLLLAAVLRSSPYRPM